MAEYSSSSRGQPQERFLPARATHPQATTALQTEVDRLYDIFVNQVRTDALESIRMPCALPRLGCSTASRRWQQASPTLVMPFDAVMTEFTNALAASSGWRIRAGPRRLVHEAISNPPRSKPFTLENTMTDHQDDPKTAGRSDRHRPRATSRRPTAIRNRRLPPCCTGAVLRQWRGQAQAITESPDRPVDNARHDSSQQASRKRMRSRLCSTVPTSPKSPAHHRRCGTTQRPENSPVVAAVKTHAKGVLAHCLLLKPSATLFEVRSAEPLFARPGHRRCRAEPAAGTVVGRETATASRHRPSATDGTETAVGVLGNDVDATLIDREVTRS